MAKSQRPVVMDNLLLVTHVELAKTWVWEVTRCYTKFQYKHGEVSQMWFCHLTP